MEAESSSLCFVKNLQLWKTSFWMKSRFDADCACSRTWGDLRSVAETKCLCLARLELVDQEPGMSAGLIHAMFNSCEARMAVGGTMQFFIRCGI